MSDIIVEKPKFIFNHKKPCKEFKASKDCQHLKAQKTKFKKMLKNLVPLDIYGPKLKLSKDFKDFEWAWGK